MNSKAKHTQCRVLIHVLSTRHSSDSTAFGKSSESIQRAITGQCLRMRHRPSAQRTVPIRKICPAFEALKHNTAFQPPVTSSYDFGLWRVDHVTSWLASNISQHFTTRRSAHQHFIGAPWNYSTNICQVVRSFYLCSYSVTQTVIRTNEFSLLLLFLKLVATSWSFFESNLIPSSCRSCVTIVRTSAALLIDNKYFMSF